MKETAERQSNQNRGPANQEEVEAINFLTSQEVQPSSRKSRADVQVNLALQTVEQISHRDGLTPDQLVKLLDVAASRKFGESVSTKLVMNLIPSSYVPGIAAVKAISWICTNTLSTNMQALLIKWLVVVYNLLEEHKSLQSLYGIIFLFLENDSLCPHVCHLLCYLTTAEHVKHFRIRKLLDLRTRVGSQPHLLGLLSVYRMLYPGLLVSVKSANKVWFRLTEDPWKEAIRKVQEKNNPHPLSGFHLTQPNTGMMHVQKRRKVGSNAIPVVQAAASMLDLDTVRENRKVSLEQVSTFKDLLHNIDNIELPSQIAAVLESSHLQHVVTCNADLVTLQRLNFWLNHSLHEEFISCSTGCSSTHTSERLLETLIMFSSFLQECVPASELFVTRYLFTWNGQDYRPLILKLITQLSLQPFQKLNDLVLEPLRKLFFTSQVYIKCQVMYCLTELLRNFATVEIPRQKDAVEHDLTKAGRSFSASLFLDEEEFPDYFKAMYEYIRFVDRICAVGLQTEEDHTLLQHYVLSFYELVSRLHRDFEFPFVVIPSAAVVYRLLFSTNPVAITRLCDVIVNYKDEFEKMKKSQRDSQSITTLDFPDGFGSIQRFNQYILDICDCLWRNKAFVEREKSCFSVPRSLTDSLGIRHINEAFSIHNHVALSSIAWNFLHETQPGDMKLNPSLIKDRVRHAYLEYMEQRNLDGIIVFLDTFIRKRS